MLQSASFSLQRSSVFQTKERRSDSRQTMVLRVAIIDDGQRALFCLLKNISPNGVQIRTYTGLDLGKSVKIFVGEESPVAGKVVWVDGKLGGVQFDRPLSPAKLLRVEQNVQDGKRRASPRICTRSAAKLRSSGRSYGVQLRDLSNTGAKIRAAKHISVTGLALLELPGLPPITCFVRWNDGLDIGLSFTSPVSLETITTWLHGRLQASVEQSPD